LTRKSISNAIAPSKDVDTHLYGSQGSIIADQLDGVGSRNPITILDEQNTDSIIYGTKDQRRPSELENLVINSAVRTPANQDHPVAGPKHVA